MGAFTWLEKAVCGSLWFLCQWRRVQSTCGSSCPGVTNTGRHTFLRGVTSYCDYSSLFCAGHHDRCFQLVQPKAQNLLEGRGMKAVYVVGQDLDPRPVPKLGCSLAPRL